MAILVTGVAGFIGSQVAARLLDRGQEVIGVDNFNSYYDPSLKEARVAPLLGRPGFSLRRQDIADRDAMLALADGVAIGGSAITGIVHLAAQAGVRYSLIDPYAYVTSNVMGQVVMLELARRLPDLAHFVYASSSSVYGGNDELPLSVDDRVDRPLSLYAATKRADELIGHTYTHLYGIKATGLRFFTVYGPWGRPDMAPFLFCRAILAGEPIRVFNHGDMSRDFTYIDDIVTGTLAALDRPPAAGEAAHRLYNLGNSRSERLMDFIAILERHLGRKAIIDFQPMQPGDMADTYADIAASTRDLGFQPATRLEEGLGRFTAWYRDYYRI